MTQSGKSLHFSPIGPFFMRGEVRPQKWAKAGGMALARRFHAAIRAGGNTRFVPKGGSGSSLGLGFGLGSLRFGGVIAKVLPGFFLVFLAGRQKAEKQKRCQTKPGAYWKPFAFHWKIIIHWQGKDSVSG